MNYEAMSETPLRLRAAAQKKNGKLWSYLYWAESATNFTYYKNTTEIDNPFIVTEIDNLASLSTL